ncbi:glutamate racemase [Edaphobacter albus]|uniref:glutamate racemase n=1 Tax=Edaphobacter sp. 4G125 TaxID=2763071 RepID=UPI001644B214|nr:glutamate racemase [Edaphobacter sp. 4G125]QNI38051.1 glutamate racemase [Edaphobacter sp. 4G125]
MKTIGVFDSGFGGLTVLRELLPLIPDTRFVYLGDTARLPYGSKSHETIARYAISSAKFLADQGAELLVIACNTATALALEDIRTALPLPVVGVVEPGAQAALVAAEKSPQGIAGSHVLVLATTATTQSGAYSRTLHQLGLRVTEKACPLLVPLVEEGWLDQPAHMAVTLEVLRLYLLEALEQAPEANILLLGCTHYPLLKPLIETTLKTLHHPMQIIDSAAATASAVAASIPGATPIAEGSPGCVFYATDSIEKFQRLGSAFLNQTLPSVELVDLGG